MTNAGKLRHRITIQRPAAGQADGQDEYGQPDGGWEDVATRWASVEPLQGREFWAAQQVNAEITVRIRLRYLPGISPTMRAVYGCRTFDILGAVDPEERHVELQLMCREVISS